MIKERWNIMVWHKKIKEIRSKKIHQLTYDRRTLPESYGGEPSLDTKTATS